ncbi:hypothetical protein [Paenibacillus sp. HW567]|uniref:hypothetical protein n=1 Tax=Paenibacillus sp. HW567 TaxID=1034769 RepID=UPI00036E4E48|nr:hypothetical protein [Paenibacillus sp. HW567]
MGRTGISNEYQDIKAAAVPERQLYDIEVTDKVMARIRTLDLKLHHRQSTRRIRFAGKTTAFTGMMAMLLLITVTGYAASEYIQIRNKAGEVKVQEIPVPNKDLNPAVPAPYYKYAYKIMDFAKPGELIAYYYRGEKLYEGAKSALQFARKELRLTDYGQFLAEMKKLKTPILPKEAKGYVFDNGDITPGSPSDEQYDDNPLYRQTLDELIAEARQNTGRNLFMKAVPWTEASSVSGRYTKQGAVIGITAYLMKGGSMQVYQDSNMSTEKLTVEGREILYTDVSRPDIKPGFGYHYLNWYNEKQDVYYTISTYGNGVLTKEKLLELAAELIHGVL